MSVHMLQEKRLYTLKPVQKPKIKIGLITKPAIQRGLDGGKCVQVLLATDPDREGEAISWHIAEELRVSVTK